jgi:hypothetical protein
MMVHQTLIFLVSLIVQHEEKMVKKMKVMKEKFLMMLKWKVMVLEMNWRFKLISIQKIQGVLS